MKYTVHLNDGKLTPLKKKSSPSHLRLIEPPFLFSRLLIFLFLITVVSRFQLYGQGEIPVNMYTGSPGISINLYTLTSHDVSDDISLFYNPNGVNLNSGSGPLGVGWNLNIGGIVSRDVRGLPDDFKDATRTGWLYSSQGASIDAFAGTSDLSTSTCTDEQTDQSFISSLQYLKDSEPDWYTYTVGGVSGHFVFNKLGTISLIPYRDISIVPTYQSAPTNMTIVGWTITTNDGFTYTFSETCPATKVATKNSAVAMFSLYDREYNMYQTQVSFNGQWMLTEALSHTGATIDYEYNSKTNNGGDNHQTAFYSLGGSPQTQMMTAYSLLNVGSSSTSKTISSITTSTGVTATFVYSTFSTLSTIILNDNAQPSNPFKVFNFTYTSNSQLGPLLSNFLSSIQESDASGCNQKPPYLLYYNGANVSGLMTAYPGQGTLNQDFWGFYNGANNTKPTMFPTIYVYPNEAGNERYRIYPIPNYTTGPQVILSGNANRIPNASAILTGTLQRMIYPSGGESDFNFELNQYFDSKAGKNQLASGLRIKSITYTDGVNPAANINKTFSYVDDSGNSTGRLISRPSFALPTWQYVTPTSTLSYSTLIASGLNSAWNGLTAVSQNDMSPQDKTNGEAIVGYTHVSVTRPDNASGNTGKAVFDYYIPAGFGDAATGTGVTDWSPTTMKFARPSDCPSMNIITKGETWGYPSFRNPYYDYERGLLWKKSEYNSNGTLVRTTNTSYQYIFKQGQSSPTAVKGLAYEHFANSTGQIFLYGTYSHLADVAKVVSTESVTTYDENDLSGSRFATETTQYNYSSSYHKLLSQTTRTAADGTVRGTNYSYVLDYPVTSTVPSDTTLWMIQMLKNTNRTSTLIEQVNTIQSGGTTKTTGATLVKFRPFNFNKPLLKYQLAFRPQSPTTLSPSGVVSYAFYNDPAYQVVSTVNEYDNFELPISSTGEDRNTSGTIWGYGQRFPVASFSQTRSASIGFSDFETTSVASFGVAYGYIGQGRTGANGIHPYATLTRTVSKPGGTTKYLLSFWLKNSAGTSVTLQVILRDASNSTTYSTANYTYTLNSGNYQYFVQPIDLTSVPSSSSSFTINIQGQNLTQPSGPSPSLLPMLDDVAFYPDFASLSSTTYNVPFGANSVTDGSGTTIFTSYDLLGRVKLITDQDNNIRQRFSYNFTNQVQASLVASPSLVTTGFLYINSPVQFNASPNSCISGVTYEWDFGDGNGYVNLGANSLSPTKTYTTIGIYPVKLRVSHPSYGQQVATLNISITVPLSAQITGGYNSSTQWINLSATPVNGLGTTISYQWQQGTGTWTSIVGATSSTFSEKITFAAGASLNFRCLVTSSDGRSGNSNTITVP